MVEFEVGGHHFRAGPLNPFQQLHVARKVFPLVTASLQMAAAASSGRSAADLIGDTGAMVKALSQDAMALAEAAAKMPDADVDQVLQTCLAVVSIKQGKEWFPLMRNGVLMYEHIDALAMLQIAWEVGKANLSGFTSIFQRLGQKAEVEAA